MFVFLYIQITNSEIIILIESKHQKQLKFQQFKVQKQIQTIAPTVFTYNKNHSLRQKNPKMKGLQIMKGFSKYINESKHKIKQQKTISNQNYTQNKLNNINSELKEFLLELTHAQKQYQILVNDVQTQNRLRQATSIVQNQILSNQNSNQKLNTVNEQWIQEKKQINQLTQNIFRLEMKKQQMNNQILMLKYQEQAQQQILHLKKQFFNKLQTRLDQITQQINKRNRTDDLDSKITLLVADLLCKYPSQLNQQDIDLIKQLQFTQFSLHILEQIKLKKQIVRKLNYQIVLLKDKYFSIKLPMKNQVKVEKRLEQNQHVYADRIRVNEELFKYNQYLENNMELQIEKQTSQAIDQLNESEHKTVTNYLNSCSYLLEKFGSSFFTNQNIFSIQQKIFSIQEKCQSKVAERPQLLATEKEINI